MRGTRINIKALSVNKSYTGRKRRSVWLKGFITSVLKMLPDLEIPKGILQLHIIFGVASKASDLDNLIKPFLDCLVTRYPFDDRQIYKIEAYKKLVAKGSEYIEFKLEEYGGQVDER